MPIEAACWIERSRPRGTVSHLTLIGALPVFGMAMVLRRRHAGLGPIEAGIDALAFLRPALILAVPAILCVASGIVVRGSLEFGDTVPFALGDFLRGFGDMLHFATAMPEAVPLPLIIGVAGVGLLVAAWTGRLDITHQCLVAAGLLVLPLAMALLRLPNLQYPRHCLIPAAILMVAQSRVVGAIWDLEDRGSRVIAAAILSVLLLGQLAWIQPLITAGRGSYGSVLDAIASEGRRTYSSDSRFLTQSIIDVLAISRNQVFDYVDAVRFCATPPDWYILVSETGPERLDIGPEDCRATFTDAPAFPPPPSPECAGLRTVDRARASHQSLTLSGDG